MYKVLKQIEWLQENEKLDGYMAGLASNLKKAILARTQEEYSKNAIEFINRAYLRYNKE